MKKKLTTTKRIQERRTVIAASQETHARMVRIAEGAGITQFHALMAAVDALEANPKFLDKYIAAAKVMRGEA